MGVKSDKEVIAVDDREDYCCCGCLHFKVGMLAELEDPVRS